eukprot:m.70221 g.70221  ORF g.70221 m.70221 type:complete len:55 (+) comp10002_c0_seq1:64-228(+)
MQSKVSVCGQAQRGRNLVKISGEEGEEEETRGRLTLLRAADFMIYEVEDGYGHL